MKVSHTLDEVKRYAKRGEYKVLPLSCEIMAVQHRDYPIYGVQFHLESIMTPEGKTMLSNFIHL